MFGAEGGGAVLGLLARLARSWARVFWGEVTGLTYGARYAAQMLVRGCVFAVIAGILALLGLIEGLAAVRFGLRELGLVEPWGALVLAAVLLTLALVLMVLARRSFRKAPRVTQAQLAALRLRRGFFMPERPASAPPEDRR